MDARKKLFIYHKLYDTDGTDGLFVQAVKENVLFHRAHCEEYARLLQSENFDIASLQSVDGLYKIPVIPTLFFKSHAMVSMDESSIAVSATSSGTKGKMSHVVIDKESLRLGMRMVVKTFSYHKLISCIPTNYIMLGYEPSSHNQMGAVKTAYGATRFAPALHRAYALKDTGKEYELNIEGIRQALIRYSKQGFPVRFVGFPGYMHFLVKALKENGIRLRLNGHSKVLLGGGWKQFASEGIDKKQLYALVEETLGIKEDRCREFFSAVEHPIAYCDCSHHHFHVPVYSRVVIRDPATFEPVKNGEAGLLSFITPLVKSMPLVSVATDDIAVLHDGNECGCGIASPYFEIIGRAGVQELKTCAAGAADLLGGSKP